MNYLQSRGYTRSHGKESDMMTIDHAGYQERVKGLSDAALRYTIQDAREALAAFPEGYKAGYYADEIHYAAAELRRRERAREASHLRRVK